MTPSHVRLRRVNALFHLLWIALAGRLLQVMVLCPDSYQAMADPYVSQQPLSARRGSLLDRQGRLWVANQQVHLVTADPQIVVDPARTAGTLAALLAGPPESYLQGLNQRLRPEFDLLLEPSDAERALLAPLIERGWAGIRPRAQITVHPVVVDPGAVQDPGSAADALAPLLDLPAETLADRMQAATERTVLARAPAGREDQIRSLGLAGIEVTTVTEPVGTRVSLRPLADGAVEVVGRDECRLHPDLARVLEQLGRQRDELAGIDWSTALLTRHVVVARNIPSERAADLRQIQESRASDPQQRLALQGIFVLSRETRVYPHGPVGKGWLGRVDPESGQALAGWEKVFDPVLGPQAGRLRQIVDIRGRPIPQFHGWRAPARPGHHVRLSLDLYLQGEVEDLLGAAVVEHQAHWGGLMLVDVASGEVLAMASVSGPRDANCSLGITRPVSAAFEPGSILKPLVVAAALQEGVIRPDTTFWCGGRHRVTGRTSLHCTAWNGRGGHGRLTVSEAVRSSCNVVLMQIGERLGARRLNVWFRRLGLFDKTFIWDPSREATGWVYADFPTGEPPGWSLSKRATVTYGQGITVTMAGIVRAYCALLNGGRLAPLQVLQATLGDDGAIIPAPPAPAPPAVLDPETCRAVRDMMLMVVEAQGGTARRARSRLYHIAGKTGTTLHYRSSSRTVSFAGYAPAEAPRLLALAVLDGPAVPAPSGGRLCAPLARTILERALIYLGQPATGGAAPSEEEPGRGSNHD